MKTSQTSSPAGFAARFFACWLAVVACSLAVPNVLGTAALNAQPADNDDDDTGDAATSDPDTDSDTDTDTDAPEAADADTATEADATADNDTGNDAGADTEGADTGAADAGAADAADPSDDMPDNAPGDDGASASADDDAGGDDDGAGSGGAAPATDDDAGDDDDGAGSGGTAPATDDDAGGDDDGAGSGGAAPATDDDAGGDDDTDRDTEIGSVGDDSNGPGTGPDAGDDDADDSDDGVNAPLQYVGLEPSAERERRDRLDSIENDDEGFRYRRGEIVVLDLGDKDLGRLQSAGFSVLAREKVATFGASAALLKAPARISDVDALVALDDLLPNTSFGLNHLYDRAAVMVRSKPPKAMPEKLACGCRIGVVDTGVASALPGLKHARLIQTSFNGGVPGAGLHGTVISSLIAGTRARNGVPTEIVVGDVFSGPRSTAGSAYAVIKALNWMGERGVAVINVSLSGASNRALADAIARLSARGHVVVAAAGNDGPAAPPAFPAAYPQVVAVTAVDGANQVYRYAGRGPHVYFAARGVDVVGLDQLGKPQNVTGTSFAAPAVAMRLARVVGKPDRVAVAAALKDLEKNAQDLGTPGRDPVFGAGLVEDR